jgi:hypothetical protein
MSISYMSSYCGSVPCLTIARLPSAVISRLLALIVEKEDLHIQKASGH